MRSFRPHEEQMAPEPPWPAQRSSRSPAFELAVDLGRFVLVAVLLLAVLATAWWPAPARRAVVAAGGRRWQPGGA
ncbi:MAG: hypothetical protein AB7I59_13120 [Geminicoccaceae bacterium]